MIIVAGHLTVDPAHRAAYLEACRPAVEAARAADGCLAFAVSADPLDNARVLVFERWRSAADAEQLRGEGPDDDLSARILGAEVTEYAVVGERSLT